MTRPKKSLGQNFLIDKNIINKIIKLANIKNNNIVEIGPGTGNLTQKIIDEGPASLILIEKDENLVKNLELTNKKYKNVDIYNKDIMRFDIESVLKKNSIIIGNLPYNISSQILVNLIKFKNWYPKYNKLILMFQKEVADKILAKYNTKSFGRLTVISNFRLKVLDHFNVSKNCFYPKPKVESTVLVFEPLENNNFKIKNIKNLEKVTHTFFSNKRKMINKGFAKLFKNPTDVSKILNINLSMRPSELAESDYYKITEYFEKKNSF